MQTIPTDLLAAARAGDERAFHALVAPHLRALHVHGYRMLGSYDDAEEAVQEAMTRAWRKRASCRTPAAPLPWLVQITRNEAIRIAARRRRRELAEIHGDSSEHASGADPALERMLTMVATRQALSALRPDERNLIRLRYIEDLTHGQVARALGVPEGTVKVRLHRVPKRRRVRSGELAA